MLGCFCGNPPQQDPAIYDNTQGPDGNAMNNFDHNRYNDFLGKNAEFGPKGVAKTGFFQLTKMPLSLMIPVVLLVAIRTVWMLISKPSVISVEVVPAMILTC